MPTNKRKHLRFELPLKVTMHTEDGQQAELRTLDISDGGVFLKSEGLVMPDIGTKVMVQLSSMVVGEPPQKINAVVVRNTELGIGVQFQLDHDDE